MSNCNSANAQCLGMKPDRLFFSQSASITASSNQVVITSAFSPTDVGKTLVLYNAVPTSFTSNRVSGTPYADLTALQADASVRYDRVICEVLSGPNKYYSYSITCNSGSGAWVGIKNYESKAVKITKVIDSNTVETDHIFTDTLSNLDAVLGTDNFYSFQKAINDCLANDIDLCIPDGDYLIVFSDNYAETDFNNPKTKQRIRLFSEDKSTNIQISGESKLNTRLFYEYETEWIRNVFGMGISNGNNQNHHTAKIKNLQINAPGYRHKLSDLAIGGVQVITSFSPFASVNYSANSYGICGGSDLASYNSQIEIVNVKIDGNTNKCMSIGINTTGDTYPSSLRLNNSEITRCYAVAIGCYGTSQTVYANDTLLLNIGLSQQEAFTCTSRGNAFYMHSQNSFSFNNVTFKDCHRHGFGINNRVAISGIVTQFQEYINCKFFNVGNGSTDPNYNKVRFLGCLFDDSDGFVLNNSCQISDTTFTNNSGSFAMGLVSGSSPVGARFIVNINNCKFVDQRAFTDNGNTSENIWTIIFDSCVFEGINVEPKFGGQFVEVVTKSTKNIIIRDSITIGHANALIVMIGKSKALLYGNTLNAGMARGNIVISSEDDSIELINNYFNGNNPIIIEHNNGLGYPPYTFGGQITGYDNYFDRQNEFQNNESNTTSPKVFQKLLGRKAMNKTTLTAASFQSDINFNFDFYKISGTNSGNPIDYIAFNNSSSYLNSGRGVFNGTIRLLSLGGFILGDNTGNIRTKTGSNYTTTVNEVVELFYDADTQFWYQQ